ncbi:hypothetical protein [Bowmanella denitrificans]|uniref:hypothetical protein n=1 Tax=Bowmanella denitrificans TaxID=366582 RepID=UPI001FE558A3|nr:hypothetical protein [Bowmanella denitrificans]
MLKMAQSWNMDINTVTKVILAIWCLCLMLGGATHIFDNLYFGLLPYKFVPSWLNAYWSALGVLDLVAVLLLLKWRKPGILLTLGIMLSDVTINSIAFYSLGVLPESWPLQLQTLFLGFCLGSAWLLWKPASMPERQ